MDLGGRLNNSFGVGLVMGILDNLLKKK